MFELMRGDRRAFAAELHRARGEILLQRDPGDPAPVGRSFLDRHRGREAARHAQLRTALPCFRSPSSINRQDAPSKPMWCSRPRWGGFSRTPKMPEIAQAQALLAALAEKDGVKAEAARREQRLRLESQYAEAVLARL